LLLIFTSGSSFDILPENVLSDLLMLCHLMAVLIWSLKLY
jgi:hypothetical protein